MNFNEVNRFEIIDHRPCALCNGTGLLGKAFCDDCGGSGVPGRKIIFFDDTTKMIGSLQDDNKTLKIFLAKK